MIRAVIFDFNGVLVDDESLHFELFREVLGEEGIALSESEYHENYLGYDDRGCFEAALRASGRSADEVLVDELIDRKALRYEEKAREGLRVFPGAAESIKSLGAQRPIAICSGALRREIEFALRLMGVAEWPTALIAAEDVANCKPDPEGYLLTLDALRSTVGPDLEAGHCLVVEDSLAGVEAGKAAGMWVVGVSHTYTADRLRASGADAVLENLARLGPEWVEGFFHPEISP